MRGLADDMQRLVEGVHGRIYVPQQASQLYPTAGDTTDWVYGEYDALAITVELRPASALDGGSSCLPSRSCSAGRRTVRRRWSSCAGRSTGPAHSGMSG
jgi:hypothetical protein